MKTTELLHVRIYRRIQAQTRGNPARRDLPWAKELMTVDNWWKSENQLLFWFFVCWFVCFDLFYFFSGCDPLIHQSPSSKWPQIKYMSSTSRTWWLKEGRWEGGKEKERLGGVSLGGDRGGEDGHSQNSLCIKQNSMEEGHECTSVILKHEYLKSVS